MEVQVLSRPDFLETAARRFLFLGDFLNLGSCPDHQGMNGNGGASTRNEMNRDQHGYVGNADL